MRTRRLFAPSLVITVAACGGGHKPPPPTPRPTSPHPGLVSRNGQCEIEPDCTPPASEPTLNPCNPPPPSQPVACPADMIATAPPDLAIAHDPDGICHVDCDAQHCDAPGVMRVQCPADGAPPPTYAANLVLPSPATEDTDDGRFTEIRRADFTCDLVSVGKQYTNVPCDPEIAPHVAPNVVPVTNGSQCFYGHVVVTCPYEPYELWH